MPIISSSAAGSSRGLGQFASSEDKLYVEDVFSTWLYTGNGSTQTITNGIDLAGKGGMVWTKSRSTTYNHQLYDTARGATKSIFSNLINAELTLSTGLTSFNSNGYTIGDNGAVNYSAEPFVSWTFRKAPKFFDVVTWSGNSTNRTISHSLGVSPGMIIVKRTDTTADWQVYHRSLANTEYAVLNSTAAKATGATRWNSTTATDTVFSLGTDSTVNASGGSYVAYLFAHDTTADGIVQCGSVKNSTGTSSISLGWEPQFVLVKPSGSAGNWFVWDNMRPFRSGVSISDYQYNSYLNPNLSSAETDYISAQAVAGPTQSGFSYNNVGNTGAHIYLAIRRGPMRVPTDATKVFEPRLRSGTGSATTYIANNIVDSLWTAFRGAPYGGLVTPYDRLRGNRKNLSTNSTGAENSAFADSDPQVDFVGTNSQTLVSFPSADWNNSGQSFVDWLFRRSPGFFDVVCYTGTGSARTVSHNLGVAPELMIVKSRSQTADWLVYSKSLPETSVLGLNLTNGEIAGTTIWNSTRPTASVFSLGSYFAVNNSGDTFVAYLFASAPGVSKVGSYTGTGTTKQIDCGFTAGARFVLIKRTDSTGSWYVWDSARGIIAGNDPYLLLNSTAAEVTSTDYVDTYAAGFEISSTAPAEINANGGSYIFLAIA